MLTAYQPPGGLATQTDRQTSDEIQAVLWWLGQPRWRAIPEQVIARLEARIETCGRAYRITGLASWKRRIASHQAAIEIVRRW